jgi:hypothetical protein
MIRAMMLMLAVLFCTVFTSAATRADEQLELVPQLGNQQQGQPNHGQGVAAVPETLADIYGPVATSEPLPYMAIAAAIGLAVLLLAALYYFYQKKKNAPPAAVPPWDTALIELAEARTLRNSEQALLYMEKAAQILRRYIEARFSVRSTRQTTMEFLHGRELQSNPELAGYQKELKNCLEQADMAKFAHRLPENEDLGLMEDSVTSFVLSTRVQSVEEKR